MAAEIDQTIGTRQRPHPRRGLTTLPAGGWGSAKSVARSLLRERVVASGAAVADAAEQARRLRLRQLRLGEAGRPHPFEFCENGAKATTWEITQQARHAGVLRRAYARASCEAWTRPRPGGARAA